MHRVQITTNPKWNLSKNLENLMHNFKLESCAVTKMTAYMSALKPSKPSLVDGSVVTLTVILNVLKYDIWWQQF